MKDISINVSNYRFMVTEAPIMKMVENRQGEMEPVVNKRTGETPFVVMLFAKPVAVPGERQGKGEEIKVNLPRDPGEGFDEGSYVELINPLLNTYEMRGEHNEITNAGIWFKADALKPAARAAAAAA